MDWANPAYLHSNEMYGSYAVTIRPTATADYRLGYDASSSEGLKDATSAVIRITVGINPCDGAVVVKAPPGTIVPSIPCL